MSRKGLFLFIACGITWGIPYIFIKFAVEDFSPATIILVRTAIGALVLLPIAMRRKSLIPALKKWKTVLAFACIEMVGPWWLLNSAENGHINSGLAGLLIATVPFFAMAVGYFYLGDKTANHPKNVFGLVIGFIGLGLLIGIDAFIENLEVLWVLALIVAAMGYAIAPAIAAKQAPEVDSSGMLALAMAFAAIINLPLALVHPFAEGVESPSTLGIASVVVLGVVCTALAFVMFFSLIKEVSYSRASLITYMNTAVAILAGVLFAAEPFTLGMALGLPLVAVGSYFASRKH